MAKAMQSQFLFLLLLLVLAVSTCINSAMADETATCVTTFTFHKGTNMPLDYCSQQGGFNAMPYTEAIQKQIQTALASEVVDDKIPLGAWSDSMTCTNADCTWYWGEGIFTNNGLEFSNGVRNATTKSPSAIKGRYMNWGSEQPIAFNGISADRRVYMNASYLWRNGLYSPSTLKNALCGHYDPKDKSCPANFKKGFPWWAGLIIAVGCVIIIVVVVVVLCCCCKKNKDQEEELKLGREAAAGSDNPTNIPTQTQLGMSRSASMTYNTEKGDEMEYAAERGVLQNGMDMNNGEGNVIMMPVEEQGQEDEFGNPLNPPGYAPQPGYTPMGF